MKPLEGVAFIGNHLPRHCGIATFTYDLHQAVATYCPSMTTGVVAMTDPGASYDYPASVQFEIHDEAVGEYVEAAEFLNNAKFDVACLQHEYGIFGGEAGAHITELLSKLKMPVVTSLHTVLATPTPDQRDVMTRILEISTTLVVMSEKGRFLLQSVHNVPAQKIEIIPHGVPDFPFIETHKAKRKLGFDEKTVILTFGLLSPAKGIENVIDAMPGILQVCPNAVYIVLGATHPSVIRHNGEGYRDSLSLRARELGVENHVVFINQFVDQAKLLQFISMCDVYVTPYLNEAQMTSGTLAYAFALGKAVVSTPYWHAKDLLRDGRGVLVPFGDADAISREISDLLTNDVRRHSMRKRAYAEGRSMTWAQTAKRYVEVFQSAHEGVRAVSVHPREWIVRASTSVLPEIKTEHLLSLCDSTGMLQHALHSIPDRSHGYCVDDNARGLLLSSLLSRYGEELLPDKVTSVFAAFIQHAWNPDTGRFRNFMNYQRQWLEEAGSEDSHGRTLWALAECAANDRTLSRRNWAVALFRTALPAVEAFTSPRAWAFSLLGLDAYCGVFSADVDAGRIRRVLADKLMVLFSKVQTQDWTWFEEGLAYDNARLSQALIQTGLATHTRSYVDVGLASLRWLMSLQTTTSGYFRPVGTESFGQKRSTPQAFDQQPVEAAAAISACLAASQAEESATWPAGALRAFGWFLGENDLQTSLIDPATGGCYDGLHPDRPNENKGAESVLSYLLGFVEMHQFQRMSAPARIKHSSVAPKGAALPATVPRTISGEVLCSNPDS